VVVRELRDEVDAQDSIVRTAPLLEAVLEGDTDSLAEPGLSASARLFGLSRSPSEALSGYIEW
jgi:hypothetical protein